MTTSEENAELDAIALQTDERRGEIVLQKVYDFLSRFVCYPSGHALVAHVLWIIHTHLMSRWDSTPRLAFLSAEPASGKTRALEITELLVPNPVCAVNVSPQYLFRKIGADDTPTILYDEIDTVFGPKASEHEDIRGLLNAGHRQGAIVGRCTMNGKNPEPQEFPAYAAVALAGLGWLPDTILSRSVIIRMRRRHAGEQVEPYRRRLHQPAGAAVHDMIAMWAATKPDDIAWPELPSEIQDRAADMWESLVAVADMAGGKWPELARAAAVALVGAGKDADPSLGIRLLSDIREIFGDRGRMPSAAILEGLHAIDEAPWRDIKGKPIDSRLMSKLLREYGVRSKDLKTGSSVLKGYDRSQFEDAWTRYLPGTPEKSATSATSATSPIPRAQKVADTPTGSATVVADRVAPVADAISLSATKNANGFKPVAAVALVALIPGVCEQCRLDDGQATRQDEGPWLHPECRRYRQVGAA